MPDLEKVIKGLEEISDYFDIYRNEKNDYYSPAKDYYNAAKDAIALLKQQEAAYQGAEELLRQKTILFDDAIKRLKEQELIQVTGTRRSGKTTKLLNLAAENGYVIVEPNERMADYVRHIATEKGLNVNVISARELLYRQHVVVREKYLVDELKMFMASLGIVGYSDEAVII